MITGLLISAALIAADPASAADLPAGDPAIATLARELDPQTLVQALADADPLRRRGAARLLPATELPPLRLFDAALAAQDPAVRRILIASLRGREVPAARLVELPEPTDVLALLRQHPGDPLADATVRRAVAQHLGNPACAGLAAALVVARGRLPDWREHLLRLVADPDDVVSRAAHGCLEHLTRIQRSHAAYAGDRALLARDWADALAAKPATATDPPPDLALLAAELPRPDALVALLAQPEASLVAVERLLDGAERGRRRELGQAARLLERAVSVHLWTMLGEAGLAGLDDADPAVRRRCLNACVAAIRAGKDRPGLRTILGFTDDHDASVRTAAWDWLVRLGDEAKSFRIEWRIGSEPNHLFTDAAALFRLRRALRSDSSDERLAALTFAGATEAKALRDAVQAQLFAPEPLVVDAALDTLGRLDITTADLPHLLRLAQDTAQPALRRAKALEWLGKLELESTWVGSTRVKTWASAATMDAVVLLCADPDPLVATAAGTAMATIAEPLRRTEQITRLLADPRRRLAALALLTSHARTGDEALVRDLLDDPDPAVHSQVLTLLARWHKATSRHSESPGKQAVEAILGEAQRNRISALAASDGPARIPALTMALRLRLTTRELALPVLAQAPRDAAEPLLTALVDLHQNDATALTDIARIVAARADVGSTSTLLHAADQLATRNDRRRTLLLEHGQIDLLRADDSDTDFNNGVQTRILRWNDGTTWTLTGTRRGGSRQHSSSSDYQWKPSAPLPPGPSDEALAALADTLAGWNLTKADDRAARDRTVAWLRDADPAPGTEADGGWKETPLRGLLLLRPQLRPRLATAINADQHGGLYYLRDLYEAGNPDLLPATLRLLPEADSDWELQPILTWLQTLPRDSVLPHLATLVEHPQLSAHESFSSIVTRLAPVPADLALRLASEGRLSAVVIQADSDPAAVATALAGITPAQVLAHTGQLKQVRQAATDAIDAALAPLVAADDDRAAAWLRSGLPLAAGMQQAYRRAETSTHPGVWLAGAALAVKEGRLEAPAFLARIPDLPPLVQVDAAAAAGRLMADRLPTEAAAVATILRRAPARALLAWSGVAPPDAQVVAALSERARDRGLADVIGLALSPRLRTQRAAWEPLLEPLRVAAKGRLDHLR